MKKIIWMVFAAMVLGFIPTSFSADEETTSSVIAEEQAEPSTSQQAQAASPNGQESEPQKEKASKPQTESSQPAEKTKTPIAAQPSPESSLAAQQTNTSTPAPQESAQESPEPPAPESAKPLTIIDVQVRGNQIVSTNTILSKVRSQKGQPILQEIINEDLKRLYGTGYFQDVKMDVEEISDKGYQLVISVEEKPIVRSVVFEGATVFKEDKLRKELKVIEGQILDRKVIKQGAEGIKKLYSNKGFKFIEIQPDVTVNEATKEATVIIKIIEGEKYKIKEIRFEGLTAFKPKKIRKLMKTKKQKWYNSGVFKEVNFQEDLERIQFFFQQEGYLDFKVEPKFDYDKSNKKIIITLLMDEGSHYVTGEVQIQGNKLFPESEIWQSLEMLPGLTYSQYYLSKDLEKIKDYYSERGYMDARIIPQVKLNKDSGKVDVTYDIEEGDLYFVEKVLVRGNTKTKDIVIRRELRIRPGDKFDGEKIRKSKQRLENLGFFDDITYDTEPSAAGSNRKDLIFRVKEKRTGELSFGGGVSSIERLVGFAEISQRNFDLLNWPRFTGAGQSLSLRARIGSETKDYSINFVEPYLLNRPISLGIDLYNSDRNLRNTDYDESRLGAAVTLSKLFKDIFRVGGGYTLERVKLDDLSEDAPESVRQFAGKNWLSKLRSFTSYDTRDNVFNPTKGLLLSLSADLVGSFLGGDQDYYVLQTSATKYFTVFKKHQIELGARVGTSQEFGDSPSVPVFDRFFAGGLGTVRGYDYRRVGPIEAGDAVGGQTILVANAEYTFPFPYVEFIRGAAFIDAGHVNPDAYKITFGDIAVSVGPGVKIKTPFGAVALYYGYPIFNKDEDDRNGRFEFSLGRGF